MKYHSTCRRVVLLASAASLLVYFLSAQSQLQTGYAVFTADTGSRIPVGSALFTYTNSSGVLVSQAGVGAVEGHSRGQNFCR